MAVYHNCPIPFMFIDEVTVKAVNKNIYEL